ncbi:MAG: N-methyl-D-aspartate receptor NMDAR2C subunit [Gemmatimonadales bacterium]
MSDAGPSRTLRWGSLWQRLGAEGDPAPALAEIERRYSEPGRHYHTLTHLEACLDTFESVRSLCERPDEAELALWLHDLIWTPLGADNEARSAAWAEGCCRRVGLTPDSGDRVARLFLATRHDGTPLSGDAAVVADVDLAILGASPEVFERYESAIRAEYAGVPEVAFRVGRARVLRSFLDRPAIFTTMVMHEALERRARANLLTALTKLTPANHPDCP